MKVALQEEQKAKKLKKNEDLDSNGEDELSESGTVPLYHKIQTKHTLHEGPSV